MVGRYVRFAAAPGQGGELAALLLAAADSVRGDEGCRLYAINRETGDPDVVWVTELWVDQAALDASIAALATDESQVRIRRIGELLTGAPERIELEPLGGIGID